MMHGARSLQGHALHALDGEIGHVRDLYIDDDRWRVRWVVVDTGSWMSSRRVLVSALAAGPVESSGSIAVHLTRELVRRSPDIDFDKPVSRQQELEYFRRYGWPYFWLGGGAWAGPAAPELMGAGSLHARGPEGDMHLRSSRHMAGFFGYQVHGTDGDVGHVDDVVIDDDGWGVPYLVVDTSNWGIGHKVLVPTTTVGLVSWEDARVCVGLSREAIGRAQPWASPPASERRAS